MIASERVQNIIVVSVIIVAVISSMFLGANAAYYGNTYALAERVDVSLLDIEVRNIDHDNETINPRIILSFNLATTSISEGNVKIIFFGATVWLNNDLLSLTSFSHEPTFDEEYLTPDYNHNITMGNSATTVLDKQAILDADTSGTWEWYIRFRYAFIVFDVLGTRTTRWLNFNSTLTTFG